MSEAEARGAVPADDLAVAGLSGRRASPIPAASNGRSKPAISPTPPRLRDWLCGDAHRRLGFLRRRVSRRRRIAPCQRMSDAALRDIAELAAAFVPSRERQLETTTQGRAFIDTTRAAWAARRARRRSSRPAAVRLSIPSRSALSAPAHGIPLEPSLHAFLHAVVSNWISAGAPA